MMNSHIETVIPNVPLSVSVSYIIGSGTSVLVSITPSGSGPTPTSYIISYKLTSSSSYLGSATAIDVNYVLTGLTINTGYSLIVQSALGGQCSNPTSPVTFTTPGEGGPSGSGGGGSSSGGYTPIGPTTPDSIGTNPSYHFLVMMGQSNMGGGATYGAVDPILDPVDPDILQFCTNYNSPSSLIYVQSGQPVDFNVTYSTSGATVNASSSNLPSLAYGAQAIQAMHPLFVYGIQGNVLVNGTLPVFNPMINIAKEFKTTLTDRKKIMIIHSATGGSSLAGSGPPTQNNLLSPGNNGAWLSPGTLLANTLTLVQAALTKYPNSTIDGMFYIQGETDGGRGCTLTTYQTQITTLINTLRSTFNIPKCPFVFGSMNHGNTWFTTQGYGFSMVDQAQQNIPYLIPYTSYTKGPSTPTGAGVVHYDALGIRQIAADMVRIGFINSINNTSPSQNAPFTDAYPGVSYLPFSGAIISVTQTGSNIVTVLEPCISANLPVNHILYFNGVQQATLVSSLQPNISGSTDLNAITLTFPASQLTNGTYNVTYVGYNGPSGTYVYAGTVGSTYSNGSTVTFTYSGGGGSAPANVTSLANGTVTTTTIPLTWTNASGASSYNINYRTPPGSGSYTLSNTVSSTPGTVTGLTSSTAYDVQVVSVNGSGSSSGAVLTNITTASAGVTPPGNVSGFAQGATTSSSIVVSWVPPSTGGTPTSYTMNIRFPSGSGSYTFSGNVSFGTNTYTYSSLSASTGYDLQILATNSGGSSSGVAIINAMTSAPAAPANVTSLTAGTPTSSTIPLTWTNASGATSYNINYRTPPGSGSYTLSNSVSSTPGTVTGLASSTAYDVQVVSVNSGGSSSGAVLSSISTAAVTYMLDTYGTNVLAAYSLRKLYTSSTNAIRVTNGTSTVDIGFDSSGNLNTAALLSGTNQILTWYDQSPAAKNMTVTGSNNITVVNNVYSGKAGMHFIDPTTSPNCLQSSGNITIPSNIMSIGMVNGLDTTTSGSFIASNGIFPFLGFNQLNYDGQANYIGVFTQAVSTYSQRLAITSPTSGRFYQDGVVIPLTLNLGSDPSIPTGIIFNSIGGIPGVNDHNYAGFQAEVIFWSSDQTANQSPIAANQKAYWNTP